MCGRLGLRERKKKAGERTSGKRDNETRASEQLKLASFFRCSSSSLYALSLLPPSTSYLDHQRREHRRDHDRSEDESGLGGRAASLLPLLLLLASRFRVDLLLALIGEERAVVARRAGVAAAGGSSAPGAYAHSRVVAEGERERARKRARRGKGIEEKRKKERKKKSGKRLTGASFSFLSFR